MSNPYQSRVQSFCRKTFLSCERTSMITESVDVVLSLYIFKSVGFSSSVLSLFVDPYYRMKEKMYHKSTKLYF